MDTEGLAAWFRDQLVAQYEKLTDRRYPGLLAAEGVNAPLVTSLDGVDQWDSAVEISEWDKFGIAVVLADQANDGGAVGIVNRRKRYPIITISDFVTIGWQALTQAKAKGLGIESRLAVALLEGIRKKINAIFYSGELDYGVNSVFTVGIPRFNSISTFAAASTTKILLSLLTAPFRQRASDINTVGTMDIVVSLPTLQHELIADTYFGAETPGMTVKMAFLKAREELGYSIRFVEDNSLRGRGDGGTDVMLVMPYDTSLGSNSGEHSVFNFVPNEFEIPDELSSYTDTVYKQRAFARVGGVYAPFPLDALIVQGI